MAGLLISTFALNRLSGGYSVFSDEIQHYNLVCAPAACVTLWPSGCAAQALAGLPESEPEPSSIMLKVAYSLSR